MNLRRRKSSSRWFGGTAPALRGDATLLLPWERQRAWLSQLLSARRWRSLFASLLLALLVVSALQVADRRARLRSTRASIAEVQRAVTAFRAEMGRCPRSITELVHPPRVSARYLLEAPIDGWGRELYVRCPSPRDPTAAEVVSAGPSGSFSEDDNIL
jgi:hypothetical protein